MSGLGNRWKNQFLISRTLAFLSVSRSEEEQGPVHRLAEGQRRSQQQTGGRLLPVPVRLVRRIPVERQLADLRDSDPA